MSTRRAREAAWQVSRHDAFPFPGGEELREVSFRRSCVRTGDVRRVVVAAEHIGSMAAGFRWASLVTRHRHQLLPSE